MIYEDIIEVIGDRVQNVLDRDRDSKWGEVGVMYEHIPDSKEGITGIVTVSELLKIGVEDTLAGYRGKHEGTIQIYTRLDKYTKVVDIKRLQDEMYREIKKIEGRTENGLYVERVGVPDIQSVYRDNQDNIIQVMTFYIRYKK